MHLAEQRLADGGTRLVALRRLPVRADEQPERSAALRDRLRHLGWLRHAGFAAVDDVVHIGGQVSVVSEFVEGIGLDALVNHLRACASPMPLRPALELVGRLAASLDAGWSRSAFHGGPALRLVHGDVRPANVRVDESGAARLVDTGIAALLFDLDRPALFPPAYLAPERVRPRQPERAADVYGLGATLIDLLTLDPLDRPRLRSDAHARLVGDRAQRIAQRAGGDAALGALVAELCAFEPAHRPELGATAERCRAFARRISDEGFAVWAERVVPVALASDFGRVRAPNPLSELLLVEDPREDPAEASDPFGLFGGDLAEPPGAPAAPPRAAAPPARARPRPVPFPRVRPEPPRESAPIPVVAAPGPSEPAPLERTEDLPPLELTGEISVSLELDESVAAIDLSDLTEGLDAPPPSAPGAWDEAPTRQDEVRALMKARQAPVDPTWADETEGVDGAGRPPVVITGWGREDEREPTAEVSLGRPDEDVDPTRSDPAPADRTTELPVRRAGGPAAPVAGPVVMVHDGPHTAEPDRTGVFSAEAAVVRPVGARALRREQGVVTPGLLLALGVLGALLLVLMRLVLGRIA